MRWKVNEDSPGGCEIDSSTDLFNDVKSLFYADHVGLLAKDVSWPSSNIPSPMHSEGVLEGGPRLQLHRQSGGERRKSFSLILMPMTHEEHCGRAIGGR